MNFVFLVVWTALVAIGAWGGLLIKVGLDAQAGGALAVGLLTCGFCILTGLIVAALYARKLTQSSLLSAYFVLSIVGTAAYVIWTDVRPPLKPPEYEVTEPVLISESYWRQWGLVPTIRDGQVVELRAAKAKRPWTAPPAAVMRKLSALETLEYAGNFGGFPGEFVGELQALRHATFRGTDFSDHPSSLRTFELLSRLPHLETLSLEKANGIDAKTTAALANFHSIVELNLNDSRPAWQLSPLSQGLPQLKVLHLAGTGLDDQQLREFLNLPSLELIDVSRTKVTPAGIKEFHNKRSNVQIKTDTPPPIE